jgi:general secretion pathway protein I
LLRSTEAKRTAAGFTLIEVLVALAIVAISLSSIGALIATTIRGTRSLEEHWMRLEIARAIATALPERDQLVPGNLSGEIAGHRWRVDVSPFIADSPARPSSTPWVPQTVVVTVQSLAGTSMQVSTVRLHRRTGG